MPTSATFLRHAGTCLALLLTLQAPAHAQAPSCTPQSLVGSQPGQVGTVVICAVPLRADPAFRAMVALLNELATRSDDLRASVQKLTPALNGATQGVSAAQAAAMANSVTRRLQADGQASEARVLREIDRLRVSLEDVQEKLVVALADPARQAEARAAMGGAAGEALGRLDFATAQRLLDDAGQIKTNTLSACAKDPKLLQIARGEAEQAMQTLKNMQAPVRCARTWPTLTAFYDSAKSALERGDLNAACSAFEEFKGRSMQVTGELSTAQMQVDLEAQQVEFHVGIARSTYVNLHGRTTRSNRVLAQRNASTPDLRRELGRADELLARAEEQAARGEYSDALGTLVDATNAYRSIEFRGGGYTAPFVPMPKPSFQSAAEVRERMRSQANASKAAMQASGIYVCN